MAAPGAGANTRRKDQGDLIMGMFDTFQFADPLSVLTPKCAHGHPLPELQTKDLGEEMVTITILDGRAWVWDGEPRRAFGAPSTDGASVEEVTTQRLKWHPAMALAARTVVLAYNHCVQCDPVYTATSADDWRGGVEEHRPWCEYELEFQGARLERVESVRVESREVVAQRLRSGVGDVLQDDDRVVRRAIENHRKRVKRG